MRKRSRFECTNTLGGEKINRKILVSIILSVLVALFLVAGVHAAEFKLIASDGATDDQLGYSVAIDGDYAIVGAWMDDDNGDDSGSAYIFKRDGTDMWTQQAKLIASDGAAGDYFGCSVAIAGDYAIVGAYGDDVGENNNQGSAYIFEKPGSGWTTMTETAKLTASDGAISDNLGISVAIGDDYAVVGAYGDDSDTGSAYIFKRAGTSWNQEAKLLASDGAVGDYFGKSVAIDGAYAIVGANGADDDKGSAYVYDISDEVPIPEFQTIAIPIASILGLLFFFNYRKRRKED